MFPEKVSGKNINDHKLLREMIGYIREGDLIKVKSPDRLSRSTTDLLALIKRLQEKGVEVEFVDDSTLNTSTPQGEFMLIALAAVAQLERATIRARQAEGSPLLADSP